MNTAELHLMASRYMNKVSLVLFLFILVSSVPNYAGAESPCEAMGTIATRDIYTTFDEEFKANLPSKKVGFTYLNLTRQEFHRRLEKFYSQLRSRSTTSLAQMMDELLALQISDRGYLAGIADATPYVKTRGFRAFLDQMTEDFTKQHETMIESLKDLFLDFENVKQQTLAAIRENGHSLWWTDHFGNIANSTTLSAFSKSDQSLNIKILMTHDRQFLEVLIFNELALRLKNSPRGVYTELGLAYPENNELLQKQIAKLLVLYTGS